MARLDSFEIAKKEILVLREKADSQAVIIARDQKIKDSYKIKDSATVSVIRSYQRSDSLWQTSNNLIFDLYKNEKKKSWYGYALAGLVLLISIFK